MFAVNSTFLKLQLPYLFCYTIHYSGYYCIIEENTLNRKKDSNFGSDRGKIPHCERDNYKKFH